MGAYLLNIVNSSVQNFLNFLQIHASMSMHIT